VGALHELQGMSSNVEVMGEGRNLGVAVWKKFIQRSMVAAAKIVRAGRVTVMQAKWGLAPSKKTVRVT